MTKRPYGDTADSVVAAFLAEPGAKSDAIGFDLGLSGAYVRVVLKRRGLRLARATGKKVPEQGFTFPRVPS